MRQIMFYTFVLHLISLAVGVRVRHRMHIRGSARVERRASVGKHGAVWAPVQHGGELHKDTSIESRAPDLPPAVRELLLAAAPETRPCRCTNHSWDQYVVCEDAVQNASSAWSFGINGYDYWGEHVNQMKRQLIPKTFDCYVPQKPSFPNDFSEVCLGAREGTVSGHRQKPFRRQGATEGASHRSVHYTGTPLGWRPGCLCTREDRHRIL